MTISGSRTNHLRARVKGEEARVEFVELFFDLVFVFAVTQLSHFLLHDLTPLGLARAALLLFAVWWVWVFTTWCTNWLDPHRAPVQLLLFGLMLAGLVFSTSIPEAFAGRGLSLAAAYVAMQVGRTLFMLWALRRHSHANYRNFQRILVWFAPSAVLWLAGGLVGDETMRFALWLVALAIECAGPAMRFRVPGMGASETADWDVEGAHMAERCGLFVIIALGESILVAGATFSELEWTAAGGGAFAACFVGTVAMWWIYFNIGAEHAGRLIAESDDPGRIARLAYTYMPIPIVAGIILVAVGDELLLAHPLGHHADLKTILATAGGGALYVFGNALFKAFAFGRWPLSHLVGLGLFVLLGLVASMLTPLALGAAATAILVLVAAWEYISLRSPRH